MTKTGKTEEPVSNPLDIAKLIIAGLLFLAGIIGFYYYSEQPTQYRYLGLVAAVGVAFAISFTTLKGRSLLIFLQDARTEVRKMVWPTRTETIQTTLVVFAFVVFVGIFLWLLDLLLGWLMKYVVGQ